MLKRIILLCGTGITLLLLWFAIDNYRISRPIADDSLVGLAHSLHAAIGNTVLHDPSLNSLSTFTTPDIAYFALIDATGRYRYHSNHDLIGSTMNDTAAVEELFSDGVINRRLQLNSGEEVYECLSRIPLATEQLGLRLVLHTYRPDAVIRRARYTMIALLSLLTFSWISAVVLYRYVKRDQQHAIAMSQRENLVKMGEMGAMLAHEIRNPLAGIKGLAQLIQRRPEDQRTSDSAERIVSEVRRLETLVTDLLDFAAHPDYKRSELNLSELLARIITLLRGEADKSSCSLIVECPEQMLVMGNGDRLNQVLLNITRNALQAMPDGGSLHISVTTAETVATIRICDSGSGIDPEIMPHIFEPFYTTKPRGSGLGLALCKKIIEEHHGSISLASDSRGTVATITLPRCGGNGLS